jgi:hypothetical protein
MTMTSNRAVKTAPALSKPKKMFPSVTLSSGSWYCATDVINYGSYDRE